VRLGLAAAIGALLLAAVIGTATIDDSPKQAVSNDVGTDGDSSTSTTLPFGDLPAGEPGVTTSTPAPVDVVGPTTTAGVSTTVAPGATPATAKGAVAANATPGATAPPAAGSYKYSVESTADGKTTTQESPVKVESVSSAGGVTKQKITMVQDGNSVTSDVAWSGAGAVVSLSEVKSSFGDFTCDWTPDFAQLAPNLKVGTTWTVDTACTGAIRNSTFGANGQSITVKQKGTYKVTGSKAVDVGGTSVPTWTIEGDESREATVATYVVSTRSVGPQQLAAEKGLPVLTEQQVTTVINSGTQKNTQNSTVKVKLLSLTPG